MLGVLTDVENEKQFVIQLQSCLQGNYKIFTNKEPKITKIMITET